MSAGSQNGINMIGLRFGRLVVNKECGRNSRGEIMWECMCDCGRISQVIGYNLRRGLTASCGHHKSEAAKKGWANASHETRDNAVLSGKRLGAKYGGEFARLHTPEVRAKANKTLKELMAKMTHKERKERFWNCVDHGKLMAGRRASPAAYGPNATLARCWSLKSPDGQVFQFKNLGFFIETHQYLFTPEQLAFESDGYTRKIAGIIGRLSPRRKHCQQTAAGWMWHINNEPASFFP